MISFIKQGLFVGSAFRRSKFDPLCEFLQACENPLFEFWDAELETYRANVKDVVETLLRKISLQTWVVDGSQDFSSVPAEWEWEQPERYARVLDELESAGLNVIKHYEILVKAMRRKIGVLE